MDSLSKRYASPFFIVEYFFERGKLAPFIKDLYDKLDDELLWELWLNKIDGMGFEEFKNKVKPKSYTEDIDSIKETLKHSIEVFENFNIED